MRFMTRTVLIGALGMGPGLSFANPVDPATILLIAEYAVEAVKLISSIPTTAATSGASASFALTDSQGNPASLFAADKLYRGTAGATAAVDVNSHVFGSTATAQGSTSWSASFQVTQPGLSGIYLGWAPSGSVSVYSNFNATATAQVSADLGLNGQGLDSASIQRSVSTFTSDRSDSGALAGGKTFVFENSPKVGDVYTVTGSLTSYAHAFGAAGSGEASASGAVGWTLVPFLLPRLTVASSVSSPQSIATPTTGAFPSARPFFGIAATFANPSSKDLTVTGVDFDLYELDAGEGSGNDLIGHYTFGFGAGDTLLVPAGQTLYHVFSTPITLTADLLNATIDTATDLAHLDLATRGRFSYRDNLGFTDTVAFSNVPEPASACLALLGLGVLGGFGRRRRQG